LSHDERDIYNNFGVDDDLAPPGYINVWGVGNVKISDIKNRQLQEPADMPEDKKWVQYAVGVDVASRGKDRTAVCVSALTYDRQDRTQTEIKYLKRLMRGSPFFDAQTRQANR
jgi:hypothetical protein